MGFTVITLASLLVTNFVAQSVDKRLQGADRALGQSRFADYPRSAVRGEFRPNPTFWLKDVDFSCASPWNSDRGQLKAGTLISKRHIIFAKHFPIAKGTRIVFVGMDGGVCPLYVDAVKEIDRSDIAIGLLNAEVTPGITPAKILPADYANFIGDGSGLPTVSFTQGEKAYVNDLNAISTNALSRYMTSRKPTDSRRMQFRDRLIVGDSGNPVFLIVGNAPILLYCLKTGGAGGGPAIHRYRFEIQQVMDELCPGYKLESFDFSKVVRGLPLTYSIAL